MGTIDRLSVVIPIAERHDTLSTLHDAYYTALSKSVQNIQFVYVIDGGFDLAARQAEEMASGDMQVQVIRLNRAFGESTALSLGFDAADSDWILTLPAYQQVEPESLTAFLEMRSDADIIVARRWPRSGSRLNQFSNWLFNRVVRAMTGLPFRDLGCGVRLLRSDVASEIPIYGEHHRFIPILAHQKGFTVREYDLPQAVADQQRRVYGLGTYVARLVDLIAVFFLARFTQRPLRFFGMIGSALIFVGGITMGVTMLQRFFMAIPLADRPIFLLGLFVFALGVQLFAVGLLGELIIFVNAKRIKKYSVAEFINIDERKD